MILALAVGACVAAAGLVWAGGCGTRVLMHSGATAKDGREGPTTSSRRVASRWWRAWRRDRAAETARWVTLVRRLAALLNAGRSPSTVFGEASRSSGHQFTDATQAWIDQLCRDVHAAAELGVPVSTSLRRSADSSPGGSDSELARWASSVTAQLAACWDISERSGASLATSLSGLANSVESQIDARAARDSALAGPRATVRVLAWLPVLALGLGMLMGTDPITTLITTPGGRVALVAGAVLTVAGRLWTRQLMRHAEAVDGP